MSGNVEFIQDKDCGRTFQNWQSSKIRYVLNAESGKCCIHLFRDMHTNWHYTNVIAVPLWIRLTRSWHAMTCHHVKLKDNSCHEISWNVTIYHHVSWNVTMLNWKTWYLVTFHDMSWHMVIFHDKTCRLSWYVMTCHDKSWNDSIWFREVDSYTVIYIMAFYPILVTSLVAGESLRIHHAIDPEDNGSCFISMVKIKASWNYCSDRLTQSLIKFDKTCYIVYNFFSLNP